MSKPTPAQVFQRTSVMDVLSELASRSLPLDGHQWTHRVRLFDALFPDMAIMPPTPAADTKPDTPAASAEPSAEPSFFPKCESASEPSAELRFHTRSVSYPFHTRFIPRFIPQALVPTPWPSQLPARANDYVSANCHSYGRERVGEPALHCGRA